jgi:dienelactone hydrolase
LAVIVAALLWAVLPYEVMTQAKDALITDSAVEVIQGDDLLFRPTVEPSSTGFIFYPGTRVDSESYAVWARMLAEAGYTVILAQMPLDLAVMDIERAGTIITAYPKIKKWAIGGHSMGGSMAAFYTAKHKESIDGMVFMGSYPAEKTILDSKGLKVLSLYGSEDLVASEAEIEARRANLPGDTEFFRIDGGNHSGFGFYGDQPGDGKASISKSEQHRIIVLQVRDFLAALD